MRPGLVLLLLLVASLSSVSAAGIDWGRKDTERYYQDCFTKRQFRNKLRGVRIPVIDLVCDFVRSQNYYYKIVIHSGLRVAHAHETDIGAMPAEHNGKWHGSRHLIGMALDFHLESEHTRSRGKTERLRAYDLQIRELRRFLQDRYVFESVGWGLYCNQNNPFFHLDTRGTDARWSRLEPTGTNYVAFDKCIDYIEDRI